MAVLGGVAGVLILLAVGAAVLAGAGRPVDHGPLTAPTAPSGPPTVPNSPGGSGGSPPGSVATRPSGRAAAVANPLYQTPRLTGYGCRAPRIAAGSTASMRRFLSRVSDCLDRSWDTQFERGEVPFAPPARVFWTRPGTSPCGSYPQPGVAAFYCSDGVSSRAMYIGPGHITGAASGNTPVRWYTVYARLLAHEYGHHVQEQMGVLRYAGQQRMLAPGRPARNTISKRIELQADCLAGVFLNGVRRSFPVSDAQLDQALQDVYRRGDDGRPPELRDHGSSRHRVVWLGTGARYGAPGRCNTWAAQPSAIR